MKYLRFATPIRRGVGGNKAEERRSMHESKYPLDGGWSGITEPERKPQGTLFGRFLYGPEGKRNP